MDQYYVNKIFSHLRQILATMAIIAIGGELIAQTPDNIQVASPATITGLRESIAIINVSYSGPGSTEEACKAEQGSAFIISDNGLALTAAHVLERPQGCPVTAKQVIKGRTGFSQSAQSMDVSPVATQEEDVALIQFGERQNGYQPISFCHVEEPNRQNYVALGFPDGNDYGNIEIRYQNMAEGLWIAASFRMNGMSGGPMIDSEGRAIGIIKGSQNIVSDTGRYIIPLRLATPSIIKGGFELEDCIAGPPSRPPIFQECDQCPTMVIIPAGTFWMGASIDDQEKHAPELPRQEVSISKFALSRTEVTVGDFEAFATDTGFTYSERCRALNARGDFERLNRHVIEALTVTNGFSPDLFPITCINWHDANNYVAWLNDKVEGEPYRLPSESELEYVIRAGSDTVYFWGNELSRACEFVNGADEYLLRHFPQRMEGDHLSCLDGFPFLSPVAQYPENAFKLFDVVGNVFEWTADCYRSSLISVPLDGSPFLAEDCSSRVQRGGSWAAIARYLRSSFRRGDYPSIENIAVGFRVARDQD